MYNLCFFLSILPNGNALLGLDGRCSKIEPNFPFIFILGGYGRAGNFSSTSVDSPATSSSGGDSPAPSSTHRSQGGGGGGVSSLTAAAEGTSSFFPGMAGGSESPSSELVSNGYQHMGPEQANIRGMSFRYKQARIFSQVERLGWHNLHGRPQILMLIAWDLPLTSLS